MYGQKIDNHDANGELVTCSICKKAVSAARFAPHLEKCMGMGRQARAKRSAAAGAGARSTPVKSGPVVLIDHEDAAADSASQTSHTESDAKSKPAISATLMCILTGRLARELAGRRKKGEISTPNSAVSLLQLEDDVAEGLI